MRDVEAPARIALVGCGVGLPGMLTLRARACLAEASVIFARACRPEEPSTRLVGAPDDPQTCARELAQRAAAGDPVVLATPADPLLDPYGSAVARHLTIAGAAWEYVPGLGDIAGTPGAIAHLGRATVASTESEWDNWRRRHPLLGATIAVTRTPRQAAALVAALGRRGADALCLPTIEIADPADGAPLDAVLDSIERYDWAVFTSANGVERFFDRLVARGGDVRSLAGVRLAAIGPATAAALAARGLNADIVPDESVAESLCAAIEAARPLAGARVLIARAQVGRDVLPDGLRRAGATVDLVEVYRTVRPDRSRDALAGLIDARRLDLVTFTSSSTVTHFVEMVGAGRARGVAAACAGPVTAATARDAGLEIAVELAEYDVANLVAAIERWFANPAGAD